MSRTTKQPYRKSRRFDRTCRCHGGCPACFSNRMISDLRAKPIDGEAQELMPKINRRTPSKPY